MFEVAPNSQKGTGRSIGKGGKSGRAGGDRGREKKKDLTNGGREKETARSLSGHPCPARHMYFKLQKRSGAKRTVLPSAETGWREGKGKGNGERHRGEGEVSNEVHHSSGQRGT